MSIVVAINHITHYTYDRLVHLSPQTIRLKPAVHSRTPILSYSLNIEPKGHFINWQQDAFGNYLARVIFPEKVKEFKVGVEVIAEMKVINPFDFFMEEYADNFPFTYPEALQKELKPYLEVVERGPLLNEWIKRMEKYKSDNTVYFLVNINRELYNEIAYTIRLEPGIYSCEETLGKRLGSCRDSAWVLVQAMRHFGLAARFVSGYLIQLKADQKAIDGPSGTEKDFTDLHAWCEVFVPGAGWIGLDPTSGLFAGEGHIPLSCTPDPVSSAPITGASDFCEVSFSYANEVSRVHEDPRVTKPYTEQQWATIMALGDKVEDDLQKGDVRLTMGGEPTFVSVDDMESAQWNTAADGDDKRKLAAGLAKSLKEHFGKNGFIQYGQGKWYPGEPLPRWKMSLYWRKDGQALWKDDRWLADVSKDYGLTTADAEKFLVELCDYLNIAKKNIHAAYEDVFYFLWQEGRLPVNVNPMKADLKDSLERKTLREILDRGLDAPRGYVVPLRWNYYDKRWLSCEWSFTRQHLYLTPGNSPVGLRLPLDSLPAQSPKLHRDEAERSTFEELDNLPDYHVVAAARKGGIIDETIPPEMLRKTVARELTEEEKEQEKFKSFVTKTKAEEENESAQEPEYDLFTIKTALTVEMREGKLFIFMPPVQFVEHYLDLLAAIELTAQRLNMPVVIEGYEPPHDNRVEKLVVTPDPGVIEVNVHPSLHWREMVSNYDTLFECALKNRLGTEKFMLDGKHTGTGGGNHITLGGSTPADSPLLRRPDLLRSFITLWQRHPGLSYLFSTQFIGTTSQAPRVDEGRAEILYELEIAFDQLPEPGEFIPNYLVDRIFRNLLIDITGNTHRAEFCIDKLYSPDSSSGRLGILEFRAFDMPPNKQMCIVQLLFIRTLTAWLWNKPYARPLIRWGTELHDKFMIHHYVREDLRDVIEQMNADGYFFDINWLEPFFEFRFPHMGRLKFKEIELNIRSGIEPWNVLGEEMSSAGTARFVDSSLERIEIKVNHLNTDRYTVLVNGMRIPLVPTAVHGEFVAGVRYRAWSPPSALHPTLGVDTPMVIDIFDTWNGRAVAGCTYHVYHPGGRGYDVYPVNSYEAEGRRISRFWDYNHTPQPYIPVFASGEAKKYIEPYLPPADKVFDPPIIEPDPEYPFTMDLRKLKKKYAPKK